jgi:threonine/homoserine efflux transporter RhtA
MDTLIAEQLTGISRWLSYKEGKSFGSSLFHSSGETGMVLLRDKEASLFLPT